MFGSLATMTYYQKNDLFLAGRFCIESFVFFLGNYIPVVPVYSNYNYFFVAKIMYYFDFAKYFC